MMEVLALFNVLTIVSLLACFAARVTRVDVVVRSVLALTVILAWLYR